MVIVKTPELSPRFAGDFGALAAKRLFDVCRYLERETEIVARFLLSLHDNRFANPDLYLLCRNIDDEYFNDVMAVMRWFRDAPDMCELQEIFGAEGEAVMENLTSRFGLGR
jgi:hypothetical protein